MYESVPFPWIKNSLLSFDPGSYHVHVGGRSISAFFSCLGGDLKKNECWHMGMDEGDQQVVGK